MNPVKVKPTVRMELFIPAYQQAVKMTHPDPIVFALLVSAADTLPPNFDAISIAPHVRQQLEAIVHLWRRNAVPGRVLWANKQFQTRRASHFSAPGRLQ